MTKYVIALGGNAIQMKSDTGTFEDQYRNVTHTMQNLTGLFAEKKNKIVITHGNGPQVGSILIQNDSAKDKLPEMPMFVCGAMTQGQIGFTIQQSLLNIFNAKQINRDVATIVTQVEVSEEDDAFKNPTKPVGPFYSEDEANELEIKTGNKFKEDAGRGYRRVVPSPQPKNIIELESIKAGIESGAITIAVGGGGIPVVSSDNVLKGVDAVIDKDKASSLLADNLDADTFIVLTAVPQVAINFGKPNEESLNKINIEQAENYMNEGHFAEGSMKPKIEAVIDFLKKNKKRKALITSADVLTEALAGKNGTWIVN